MVKHTTERTYWKSLDELSNSSKISEEYSNINEFSSPLEAHVGDSATVSRRSFIGLLSASMALAATSCRRPDHKITPTVKAVEYITPGLPLYYTTVFSHGTAAIGLTVKSREGRPIKIEGNEHHPASLGASSSWIQGSLLNLYDPDRMKHPYINKGASSPDNRRPAPGYVSPETILAAIAEAVQKSRSEGKVIRILVDESPSPSYHALRKEIEATLPEVKFVTFPTVNTSNAAEANKAFLGIDAEFAVNYAKAETILSIDADFLGTDKNAVYNIRGFSQHRKPTVVHEGAQHSNSEHDEHDSKAPTAPVMSKLIVAESMMSLTGMNADKRVKVAPEQLTSFLASILKIVATKTGKISAALVSAADDSSLSAELKEEAKKVAAELVANGDKSVVSIGIHLPPSAHVFGLAINYALGSVGADKAIDINHQFAFSNSKKTEVATFREELKSGKVGTVIFADVNPMYTGDAELQEALKKVENRFAFTLYEEETANICSAFIPTTHFLETWGDALAFDGTLSVQQPLIAPLNANSISTPELLMRLTRVLNPEFLKDVPAYFEYLQKRWEAANWETILREGVYKPTVENKVSVSLNETEAAKLVQQSEKIERKGEFVVLVTPSYALFDGSKANNSWLQELPDPISKMTWDNAAYISKKTAAKLFGDKRATELTKEYEKTETIRLKTAFGTVELPVWIQPGMQDGVIATTLGFGRTKVGVVAENIGANTYGILGASQSIGYISADVEKTGKPHKVATTQKHHDLMGRKIVQETTYSQIKAGKEELFEREEVPGRSKANEKDYPTSIIQSFQYKGHRWGMTIDMSACVGCAACVTACQAENNTPTVGKDNVANAREMNWIRIDRYYAGSEENPDVFLQPMLCQHCESAPCENVCPVAATTHSPEGLNEMTYNRCVGTKYCANNCPYKVRRFNWLNFHKNKRSPMEFVYNPDVTMRSRGVMEKCSFCVQRLTEAKHKAKDDGRLRIKDGEVVTACQQACPASAIIFGDTNDATSRVSQSRQDHRGFLVLEELNVRPQITYLAKVRNDSQATA